MIVVVAAVIRRDGQILITRRLDSAHLPGLWEFPGGKVEVNESLASALEREILEELGVRIQVENEYLSTDHEYPNKTIRLHFFNCSILAGNPQAIQVADLRWIEPAELDDFEFPPADAQVIASLRSS